jgi:hypothetical protein
VTEDAFIACIPSVLGYHDQLIVLNDCRRVALWYFVVNFKICVVVVSSEYQIFGLNIIFKHIIILHLICK